MPNSRFALHGLASPQFKVCALFWPLIHGLCAFFRSLLTPVSAAPSLPASQFTVCTSRFACPRITWTKPSFEKLFPPRAFHIQCDSITAEQFNIDSAFGVSVRSSGMLATLVSD